MCKVFRIFVVLVRQNKQINITTMKSLKTVSEISDQLHEALKGGSQIVIDGNGFIKAGYEI